MVGFEILVAIITVLAAVLLSLSILAYNRKRSRRLLLAGVVFALFLVKGIIMSLSIFTTSLGNTSESVIFHLSFDVVILLFLFFTSMQTPSSGGEPDFAPENTEEGMT